MFKGWEVIARVVSEMGGCFFAIKKARNVAILTP